MCMEAQSTGLWRTDRSSASAEPSSGTTLYLQATNGGADTMIDSKRPPERPNLTPLSYNKLNSRYLPRLSNCHCRCWSVKFIAILSSAMLLQLGMKPRATSRTNCGAPATSAASALLSSAHQSRNGQLPLLVINLVYKVYLPLGNTHPPIADSPALFGKHQKQTRQAMQKRACSEELHDMPYGMTRLAICYKQAPWLCRHHN